MKTSKFENRRRPQVRTREMMIVFSIGGVTFAIGANAVDEIRELTGIRALSSGVPHQKVAKVRHTLIRQGRRYFVVDGGAHFQTYLAHPARLMVMRHSCAAVIVDGIDRMQEIHSIQELPEAFGGEERRWYRGLALIKGKVVPVVHADAFLTKAETTILNACVRNELAAEAVGVTA